MVPHLAGIAPAALAQQVAQGKGVSVTLDGHKFALTLEPSAAPFLRRLGGRSLGQIAEGTDWMAFQSVWGPVHRTLTGFNLLHYSQGARP